MVWTVTKSELESNLRFILQVHYGQDLKNAKASGGDLASLQDSLLHMDDGCSKGIKVAVFMY